MLKTRAIYLNGEWDDFIEYRIRREQADERAYAVFRPLANRAGVALAAEDFSDPGPTGLHFLRVQLLPASRPLLDFGLEGS